MPGIVNLAGNALKAFGTMHPAIKWGVAVLAGLLAVEFVGKEAISLYVAMQTAPAQIEQINRQAEKTRLETEASKDCTPSMSYIKAVVAAKKANLPLPPPEPCDGRPSTRPPP